MTVHGHVKDGTIILDENVTLPEGAKVTIELDWDAHVEEIRKTLHPELQRWFGILRKHPSDDDRDLEEEYRQHLVEKYLR
ncbi:MAG: hypothetical protein IT366_17075 [Candidatus Hydrogenedentes bacterium]|nr:hypothetical protein [Candidatus Hydrogenedentota bacterium]